MKGIKTNKNALSIFGGYLFVYSIFLIIASIVVSICMEKETTQSYWIAYATATIIYILTKHFLGFRITRFEDDEP